MVGLRGTVASQANIRAWSSSLLQYVDLTVDGSGNLNVTGGGGGGGAVTVANGADIALGATTDSAVDTDTTGTVSGKLRGLVKILASVKASFGASFPSVGLAIGAKDSGGTNLAALNLDASGNLKVAGTLTTTPPAASTPANTNVVGSATNVTLLSANANRLGFTLYNDSTSSVNVKLGTTASSTSFTKRLLPNDFLTTADIGVNYTGRIDAIWDSATGNMRITELTA